ncbi:hypothetical protein Droror1_Dr00006164 [Drosera rotundifolia]
MSSKLVYVTATNTNRSRNPLLHGQQSRLARAPSNTDQSDELQSAVSSLGDALHNGTTSPQTGRTNSSSKGCPCFANGRPPVMNFKPQQLKNLNNNNHEQDSKIAALILVQLHGMDNKRGTSKPPMNTTNSSNIHHELLNSTNCSFSHSTRSNSP